jgi:WD40 repeat protein
MVYGVHASGEIAFSFDSSIIIKQLQDEPKMLDKALDFLNIKKIPIVNNPINKIDISPYSNTICFCSKKGFIGVVDEKGKFLWSYATDMNNMKIAISNSGNEIVAISQDGRIIYLLKDPRVLFEAKLNYKVVSVGISGDSDVIALASEDEKVILLSKDNKILHEFNTGYFLTSISFSNNKDKLLLGTKEGEVLFYEIYDEEDNKRASSNLFLFNQAEKKEDLNKKVNKNDSTDFLELDIDDKQKKDKKVENEKDKKKSPTDFLEI